MAHSRSISRLFAALCFVLVLLAPNSVVQKGVTAQGTVINVDKVASAPTVRVGDTVNYTYTVTNSSGQALSSIGLTDDKCSSVSSPTGDTNSNSQLDPSETWTYTCSTALTVNTTNTATVTGTHPVTGTVNDTAQATVDVINPSIAITKKPDIQTIVSGSSATFTIYVTNTGDADLTSVSVADGLASDCAKSIGSLAKDTSTSYSCSKSNVTSGFTNSATATGTPPVGSNVNSSDTAVVNVDVPGISIAKKPDSQTVVSGSDVTFSIYVTNTGDVALSGVTVSDALAPSCDAVVGDLDPGASNSYQCVVADVISNFVNSATATGTPPLGPNVSDSDTASVSVIGPALAIAKTPKVQTVASGGTANFTIFVTNTGNVQLNSVTVSDALAPDCNNSLGTLNQGQSQSYTCSLTNVTDGLMNVAAASGTAQGTSTIVTAADSAQVILSETSSCPTGLAAYWRLDELTGPNYDDYYDGHDGVCTPVAGCPTATTGQVGGGQLFNGTTAKVDVPKAPGDDSFDWGVGEGFSITFWLKTAASSTCAGNQVAIGRFSNDAAWWVGCEEGGAAAFYLRSSDQQAEQLSGPTITDGEWHHIAAVRDASANQIHLYVDGVATSKSKTYVAGFSATTGLNVGWFNSGAGYYFEGALDEIAVYNQALSTTEVQQRLGQGLADRWACQPGNYAPTIISDPVTAAVSGRLYNYDVDATGNPAPTYSLDTAPSGMTINSGTGLISWTPTIMQEGPQSVQVRATNSAGSDTQNFTVNVAEGTICPTDTIAYWKLDETSGSTYEDFFDGHNGACAPGHDCPDPGTGRIDGGQVFSTTSGINVPASTAFDWGAADSFSVELWMKTDNSSTCTGTQVVIGRFDSASTTAWWVGCTPSDTEGVVTFFLQDSSGDNTTVSGASSVTDGNWHHVAAVRNASTNQILLYVDGVEFSESATYTAGFATPEEVNIGWFNAAKDYNFVGTADEIAIYDRVLSTSEVQRHYNEPGSGYCINPEIAVVKTADPTVVNPGTSVTYSYTATNPGDDSLSSVVVSDDKCSPVNYVSGDTDSDNKLDPTESWTYTCSAIVSVDTTNTATATGNHSLGGSVSSTDTAFVNVVSAAIAVDKVASATNVSSGQTVVYTYTVTNVGDDPLSNVGVADDRCSPVNFVSGDDNVNSKLDLSEAWVYTCSTAVHEDTTNTATATGTDSAGSVVSDTDSASVNVIESGITVVKSANPTVIRAGTSVDYTYQVSNSSGDPLSSISISDDRCSPVTQVSGDNNSNDELDPGETWTYTCSMVVNADTTNTVTVTGLDPLSNPVSDTDAASVDVINPAISVAKTASATQVDPGATVIYTYQVTNPGDDPLSSVSVSDDKCSPVTGPSGDTNGNSKLDPTETWTYTCSAVLQQDTTNTATATGTDSAGGTVSDTDIATVSVAGHQIYLPLILKSQ